MELAGVIAQGTPFYAGYDFRPINDHTPQSIVAAFPGASGEQIKTLIRTAKKRAIWYALNPDEAAQTLQVERRRVVRMLEVMQERGLIELKAADARQTYTRTDPNADAETLSRDLAARFIARENGEVSRMNQVLDLVTLAGCQWNALAAYFGENRAEPCGHCTFCVTGKAQILPPPRPLPPIPDTLRADLAALQKENPAALGTPRQAARLLCGLTSPAASRARLGRNALFGTLADYPFADVLAWCEG